MECGNHFLVKGKISPYSDGGEVDDNAPIAPDHSRENQLDHLGMWEVNGPNS